MFLFVVPLFDPLFLETEMSLLFVFFIFVFFYFLTSMSYLFKKVIDLVDKLLVKMRKEKH